jgi:uncharacterized protein (DUF983 family)
MTDPVEPVTKGRPAIAQAALFGLCPRCGAPGLFAGVLRLAPRCGACGLDFAAFNVGDGPAALVMLVIGAIIVPAALVLHFNVRPPLLLELLLWPVVATLLTVGMLRVAKAALLAAEHQRGAHEGRIASDAKADEGLDGPSSL